MLSAGPLILIIQVDTMKKLILLLPILFLSCSSVNYTPPAPVDDSEISVIVDQDYDTTWESLIDHVSSTFFAIDNFEKASGLITASFGASDPNEFVDCGFHSARWMGAGYRQMEFEGTYVDFLRTHQDADLSGRMNITTREISENETEVRVNARYVLSTDSDTWTFDSGSEATIDVKNASSDESKPRTCRATYIAESSILDAVKSISER